MGRLFEERKSLRASRATTGQATEPDLPITTRTGVNWEVLEDRRVSETASGWREMWDQRGVAREGLRGERAESSPARNKPKKRKEKRTPQERRGSQSQ